MTMPDITYPGDYQIKSLSIYPAPNSENRVAVDIRALAPTLTIVESMAADCIRGSIRVLDSSGLLEGYPIRGEEMLYIEIQDAAGNVREYRLFIYKVDTVSMSTNNDGLMYTLHFVTYQRFYSDMSRVTASYFQPVSKTVEHIFNSYARNPSRFGRNAVLGNGDYNKQIIVEPTSGSTKLIVPRLTPVQAIKFLESRAYSSVHQTCSYRFFENYDSFYFVTDEYLYSKAVDADAIYKFTYSDSIPQDNGNFQLRMSNFQSFINDSRVDTFDDLHGGTYRSKVLVIDILNRVTNIAESAFNYSEARRNYFRGHRDEMDAADRHSQTFTDATFTDENARRFVTVGDFTGEHAGQLSGEQHTAEIATNRLSYFKNLNSIRVTATGPGRLDVTCGDFVDVAVPEFRYSEADKQLNPQLSGVYMVEGVTRGIDKDTYTNTYTLVKRSWAKSVDPTDNDYLLGTDAV